MKHFRRKTSSIFRFKRHHSIYFSIILGIVGFLLLGSATAWAYYLNLALVDEQHDPQAEHIAQQDLAAMVANGDSQAAYEMAFSMGDELFEVQFNALDGVGANVGQGQRFTRVPRADLDGEGEWANHFPKRITGPNAESCNDCHNIPDDDGAGEAVTNAIRDPFHSGELGEFINRNTPHVFAPGVVQLVAEEMTAQFHGVVASATDRACQKNRTIARRLRFQRVNFGYIKVIPISTNPCTVEVDTSHVVGIDDDLIVRPFQWKGSVATLRGFNRDAGHNELGMQAVEITGAGVDGDFDGVTDELSVGDITGLTIYLAAQPRPTTLLELNSLGLLDPPLTRDEKRAIRDGRHVFQAIGCASCHTPRFKLSNTIFSEPSQNPAYQEEWFPAGQDPLAEGVDPNNPITFDITKDQLDNMVTDHHGNVIFHLGAFATDNRGRAIVELYGDLKRHDMGPELAESIDDEGIAASVFLTENLWGVGSTAPYLHDGRATTLTEAILYHGGEAEDSRLEFESLSAEERAELIAFLNNLVLFKMEEEEDNH